MQPTNDKYTKKTGPHNSPVTPATAQTTHHSLLLGAPKRKCANAGLSLRIELTATQAAIITAAIIKESANSNNGAPFIQGEGTNSLSPGRIKK